MSRVVLDIEGMDCAGCAKGLEATLRNIEGVRKAVVEFEQSRAVIECDPTEVKPKQFVAKPAKADTGESDPNNNLNR